MTTASRGTPLLGHSVIDAAKKLADDLKGQTLADLVGREYFGRYVVDWTTSHDVQGEIRSHFSYAFATHLAVLTMTADCTPFTQPMTEEGSSTLPSSRARSRVAWSWAWAMR